MAFLDFHPKFSIAISLTDFRDNNLISNGFSESLYFTVSNSLKEPPTGRFDQGQGIDGRTAQFRIIFDQGSEISD